MHITGCKFVDWELRKGYGRNLIIAFLSAGVALIETFILLIASAVGAAWGNDVQYINILGLVTFILIFLHASTGIGLLRDPMKARKKALLTGALGLASGIFTVVVYGGLLGPLLFAVWWIASSGYMLATMAKPINARAHEGP